MGAKNYYTNERCLIFDESGNLGSFGRYFVISCIDTQNYKSLQNMMRRKLGLAKKTFPELASQNLHEIKANDAYPCIKYHLLEMIASKELSVSYIVADLRYVRPRLLEEKNIFYNYLMRLLIDDIVSEKDNNTVLNIISDNHTTKIASGNSFEEYIKLHLIYEKGYDYDINVIYLDSEDRNAYPIQAADYVANALYTRYEYENTLYSDRIAGIINKHLEFPYKHFGR